MSHQSPIANGTIQAANGTFVQSPVVQMQGNGMSTQVVHVRSDSDNQLEELFKVVELNGKSTQSLPFRERKLPKSFFNPGPPEQPMPVRQADSSRSSFVIHNQGVLNNNNNSLSSLPISHSRTRSSPASLPATLRAAPTPPVQHVRQHSYDIAEDNLNPLPEGWDVARTRDGHRYFINHLKQITTWHDPRKIPHQSQSQQQAALIRTPTQLSPNVSLQNLGELPSHWEQMITPDSEVYYVNHIDQTTSWFDPRLHQQQQQQPNGNTSAQRNVGMPVHPQNHTSMSPQQIAQQTANVAGANIGGATSPPNAMISQQQRHTVLQKEQMRQMLIRQLQIEKETLRKRQEEIYRAEMRLRQQPGNENAGESMQIVEMSSLQNDPFLGQNSEQHSRQESGDSGLGGMGTSYTLSRTPDDLLGNVDEMDMQEGHKVTTGSHEFSTPMEMTNITDVTNTMDSEDLVPSIQEGLSNDLSSELLHDVESVLNSNKMDSLLTDISWI